jgi:tetratricopeptide (TPR) repeat protein
VLQELCEALGWPPHSSCLAVAAASLQKLGRPREAAEMLERLRRLPEENVELSQRSLLYEAEKNLAGEETEAGRLWHCLEQGRIDEAANQLLATEAGEECRRVRSAVVKTLYERGRGRKHNGGDYHEAMRDYATTLRLDPNHTRARCDLAWLQAACPVTELRDANQAVANATRACELTKWTDHRYLAALAAVSARVGDFVSAVSWQKKAIELLTDKDKAHWQGDYESRLCLYTAGGP